METTQSLPNGGQILTEVQIQENYEWFISFLNREFTEPRLGKLLKLYSPDILGYRLATAPASGSKHYHNAHVGGYLQHIMNVVNISEGLTTIFAVSGGIINYTREERVMAAISHDIGKLGTEDGEYYIPTQDAWEKKRNIEFKRNPIISFWDVPDRALFMLQKYEIPLTESETLAIKLSDGLFAKKNEAYFMQSGEDSALRASLAYIIHWADWMASRAEFGMWKTQTQ